MTNNMNTNTTKPTCEQLWEEELDSIHREDDASWRHGAYVTEVFHREEDNTFWEAFYRRSTDGETNELREGHATITQVEPYETTITAYRAMVRAEPQ